jgi:hypothetical protein
MEDLQRKAGLGPNKTVLLKIFHKLNIKVYKRLFCAIKNTDKVVSQIKPCAGKAFLQRSDGKVVFIPNVVPGDVVDVQTFKNAKLLRRC